MIVIVDSGGANIASIQFALARLGKDSQLSHDIEIIKNASHVILPGVGSADTAMAKLKKHNLDSVIPNLQQPVLGICLGMQLLFEASEEGEVECLQLISDKIKRIPEAADISVPHMGWNVLISEHTNNPLMKDIPKQSYVYFVHSFMAPINQYTVASAEHGTKFSAIVQHNNFYGVQFHPERSSNIGQQILKNFLEL